MSPEEARKSRMKEISDKKSKGVQLTEPEEQWLHNFF